MNMKQYATIAGALGLSALVTGCSEPDVRSVRGEAPRQFAERKKEEHNLKTIGVAGLLRQKTWVLETMKQEATDASQDAAIAAESARNDVQDEAIDGLTEIAKTHTKAIRSNTDAIKSNTKEIEGLDYRVGRVETRMGPDASNPARLGFYEEDVLEMGGDAWDNYVRALDFVGKEPTVAADGRPKARLTEDDLVRITTFQDFYKELGEEVRKSMCLADLESEDVDKYAAGKDLNEKQKANFEGLKDYLARGTVDTEALEGIAGRSVQQTTKTYDNVAEFTRLQALHEDLVRAYGAEAGIKVEDVEGQPAYSVQNEDLANARNAGIAVSGLEDGRYIDVAAKPRLATTVEFIPAGEVQEDLAQQLHEDGNYKAIEPNSGVYTVNIHGVSRRVQFGSHSLYGSELEKAEAMDLNADGFLSFDEAVAAEQGRNMNLSTGVPAQTTLEKEVTAGNYKTQ